MLVDEWAMDEIASILRVPEWTADTLDAIAEVVRQTGRNVDLKRGAKVVGKRDPQRPREQGEVVAFRDDPYGQGVCVKWERFGHTWESPSDLEVVK